MSSIGFAILSVVAIAFVRIIFRHRMTAGGDPYLTLGFDHLAAFLVLLCAFGPPKFDGVSIETVSLILINCVFWVYASALDLRAYKTIDAGTCEVYGTLTLLAVTVAGVTVFGEEVSILKGLGLLLIVLAMAGAGHGKWQVSSSGARLRMVSALLVAVASVVDKLLTGKLDVQLVALSTYLMAGLVYAVLARRKLKELPSVLRQNRALLFTPLLGGLSYYCWLTALAGGNIVPLFVISQLNIAVVFILEVVLLGYRVNLVQRGCVSLVCLVGAVSVCVG